MVSIAATDPDGDQAMNRIDILLGLQAGEDVNEVIPAQGESIPSDFNACDSNKYSWIEAE
jgi:hypothetical protein